ncbi:isocitrate lyase/PEP mutase family protein [Muricoccus radiodurans]|uniref:isocitrate lyase/PEP mutase family protein n=1 Tax=Muricoccus radiodurans TaxID=2231721 RepID=UPI003CF9F74E
MSSELSRVLRDLMQPGAGVLMPGCANALAARVIEACGYKATFVTGAGIANTFLGVPDVGLVSLSELVDHVWAIRDAVSIPIIVDADTGFGNAVNVHRVIRMLERAGANSIMLEDQVFPKRCGHFEGKSVIPRAEMVQKIKAAVDARTDEALMILARTDARASHGLEDAIERANLYREAGADILFVEAPLNREELAAVTAQAPGIHICNMVIGGKTPVLPSQELGAMGYAAVVYANAALQAALAGMKKVLTSLQEKGSVEGLEDAIVSFQDRQRFVDHDRFQALERRYVAAAE